MGRFPNNPSIGWVHPSSTHVHPLAWGNKNLGTPSACGSPHWLPKISMPTCSLDHFLHGLMVGASIMRQS